MSALDAVILQELKKMQQNPTGGSSIPPVGALMKLPEVGDTVSVLGGSFIKQGQFKRLQVDQEYPYPLQFGTPKGATTQFLSGVFTPSSVACSDDTVLFARGGQSQQLYVGRRSTGFTFEMLDLPLNATYYVFYVEGVFFMCPVGSNTTVYYSTDDLLTIKTVNITQGNIRVVKHYEIDGVKTFILLAQQSSAIPTLNRLYWSSTNDSLVQGTGVVLGQTYILDLQYHQGTGRWFYTRISGGAGISTSLGGSITALTTVPPTISGVTVSTSNLSISNPVCNSIEVFNGYVIMPLSGAGIISIDPETLQATLLTGGTQTTTQRLKTSWSGKLLQLRRGDNTTLETWFSLKGPSATLSNYGPGWDATGSLAAWTPASTPANITVQTNYDLYAGSAIYEPNTYLRIQ